MEAPPPYSLYPSLTDSQSHPSTHPSAPSEEELNLPGGHETHCDHDYNETQNSILPPLPELTAFRDLLESHLKGSWDAYIIDLDIARGSSIASREAYCTFEPMVEPLVVTREVETVVEPNDRKVTAQYHEKTASPAWALGINRDNVSGIWNFSMFGNRQAIDGTTRIRECLNCVGKGFLPCKDCSSSGKANCSPCKGTGRVFEVGDKSLKGRTNSEGEIAALFKLMAEEVSGENSYDPASKKKATVDCRKCNGSGRRTCPSCDGKTKKQCSTCRGTGSVKTYIQVVQRNERRKKSAIFLKKIFETNNVIMFRPADGAISKAAIEKASGLKSHIIWKANVTGSGIMQVPLTLVPVGFLNARSSDLDDVLESLRGFVASSRLGDTIVSSTKATRTKAVEAQVHQGQLLYLLNCVSDSHQFQCVLYYRDGNWAVADVMNYPKKTSYLMVGGALAGTLFAAALGFIAASWFAK